MTVLLTTACCCSARSRLVCYLTREVICFRDALVLLLCLLPILWSLTVLALVDFLIAGMVLDGFDTAAGRLRAGTNLFGLSAAAELTFVLLMCYRVCKFRLLSVGGSIISMIVGIGMLLLVFCWWTRGVVCRTFGHVGLFEV